MIIKDSRIYDILKYIQRIGLPALVTRLVTLGKAFGWPTDIIAIVGGAFITFMGTLLQVEYYTWEHKLIELQGPDEEDKNA